MRVAGSSALTETIKKGGFETRPYEVRLGFSTTPHSVQSDRRARMNRDPHYGVRVDVALTDWALIVVCWLSRTFSVFVTVGSTSMAVPMFAD